MTTKFKVGDKVIRVKYFDDCFGDYFKNNPEPFIVSHVLPSGSVRDPNGYVHSCSYIDFYKSTSLENAKHILEEAGYIVTPPPEPMKGKAYVFRNKAPVPKGGNNDIFIRPVDVGSYSATHDVIAIVDWEEGQGLEDD